METMRRNNYVMPTYAEDTRVTDMMMADQPRPIEQLPPTTEEAPVTAARSMMASRMPDYARPSGRGGFRLYQTLMQPAGVREDDQNQQSNIVSSEPAQGQLSNIAADDDNEFGFY